MAATNMAQAAKNLSTGPRTPEGKKRAALNAIKWGLGAKNLLLVGEDEAEFERRAAAIFESLAPENAAEAEAVALIVDVMWRLGERAPRIEKALFAGESEELLMAMGPATDTTKMAPAMLALGKAIDVWERQPLPTERDDELFTRATRLDNALLEVSSNVDDVPVEQIAELHRLLSWLMELKGMVVNANVVRTTKRAPPESPIPLAAANSGSPSADIVDLSSLLQDISHRAKVVMTALLDLGQGAENQEEEQRKAVVHLSLPRNDELRKLATYTQRLEKSLTNRLEALERMRKLRPAQPPSGETNGRSREFLYGLRIVK